MQSIGVLKLWVSLRRRKASNLLKEYYDNYPSYIDCVPGVIAEIEAYEAVIKEIERIEKRHGEEH